MQVLFASNPDDALVKGIMLLKCHGTLEDSRVGPVLVAPTPIATVYPQPRKRVSFSAIRDANPFFHLVEAGSATPVISRLPGWRYLDLSIEKKVGGYFFL